MVLLITQLVKRTLQRERMPHETLEKITFNYRGVMKKSDTRSMSDSATWHTAKPKVKCLMYLIGFIKLQKVSKKP